MEYLISTIVFSFLITSFWFLVVWAKKQGAIQEELKNKASQEKQASEHFKKATKEILSIHAKYDAIRDKLLKP